MDEFLSIAIGVEKVLEEIGKTPYETLQEEKEEELTLRETSTNKQLQELNETLVKYFGWGTHGSKRPSSKMTNII